MIFLYLSIHLSYLSIYSYLSIHWSLSIYLSIYLSIHPSAHIFIPIYLSIHLSKSIYLFIHPFIPVYPAIYPISLSIPPSINLFVYNPSNYSSIHQCIHPSIHLITCSFTCIHNIIFTSRSHWLNPEWVALGESRGHESYEHKLFMRYTGKDCN